MEFELIRWLRERLPQRDNVLVGLGDDAAVLQMASESRLVVTTDMLMEGVDFRLAEVDPRRVGRKALAVNLSDLAAMAAQPTAAFISLCLPQTGGEALARELYEGMLPLAEEFGVSIAGGDTNSWSGPLVLNVTALGQTVAPHTPLLRSGAQPGDAIVVTGGFGYSLTGGHFDFIPRVREALLLYERYEIHAAVDVSDGLSLDLSHICEESRCGAIVDAASIPLSTAARDALMQGATLEEVLEHALSDGEDFELILAVPPAEAGRLLVEQPLDGVPLTRIGEFTATPGMQRRAADGALRPLVPRGFVHKLEG